MAEIIAPMPGTIVKISVNLGDIVNKETVVLNHAAMKMENEIFSTCEGTVKDILIEEGEAVETGQPLLVIA